MLRVRTYDTWEKTTTSRTLSPSPSRHWALAMSSSSPTNRIQMYVLLYPMCRLRTIAVLHGRDRRIISLALQTTQHINNNVQHNNIILSSSTLTYNNNNNNTIEILKKLLPLTIVVVHLLLSSFYYYYYYYTSSSFIILLLLSLLVVVVVAKCCPSSLHANANAPGCMPDRGFFVARGIPLDFCAPTTNRHSKPWPRTSTYPRTGGAALATSNALSAAKSVCRPTGSARRR